MFELQCKKDELPCDRTGKCFLEPPKKLCGAAAQKRAAPGFLDRSISSSFKPYTEKQAVKQAEWAKDDSTEGAVFVDLFKNPEEWTGYTGAQGSNRIWEAIYSENCFPLQLDDKDKGGNCREERVFNRLISGMHTSITSHLVKKACLKQSPDGECLAWGTDWDAFKARVGDHPDRIENLYFSYLFMLRAVLKAEPQLKHFDFDAGNPAEAERSRALLGNLLHSAMETDRPCLSVTRTPFDESTLFVGSKQSRMGPMKAALQNITAIMDCVGCDKCKLWGKLQTQGIGVALKLLFQDKSVVLSRNEVIALVNTLARFSQSVREVEVMLKGSPGLTDRQAGVEKDL